MKYLLIILLIIGCSPQKKLARLCRKSPQVCVTSRDTVYNIKKYTDIDTMKITLPIDTFLIEREKVRTRIIRHYDTLFVWQTVKPDTVQIIKNTQTIKPVKNNRFMKILTALTLVFLLLLFIYAIFRKHLWR